jgi:hypothetical protein
MFARIAFLLLLAANIGVAAWLALAPAASREAMPAHDPGVARLVLLAERDGSAAAAAAELAAPPDAVGGSAGEQCWTIGPLPTQSDLRRVVNAVAMQALRTRTRDGVTRESRGWVVFLPAPATRAEALDVARDLSARGVRDYYVVTAGPQQNTISLGLFRDRNNAERRRAEIAALSFTPAITERTEELPVYFVDVALAAGASLDWRTRVPELTEVPDRQAACF